MWHGAGQTLTNWSHEAWSSAVRVHTNRIWSHAFFFSPSVCPEGGMQQLLFDLNVGTQPRQRHNTSHKGRTDCAGGMNERPVSCRDGEGELGQRKARGALIGVCPRRPVSSRMFFGHHRCLGDMNRHNWRWPEFSWDVDSKAPAEPHGAQDPSHNAAVDWFSIANIKRIKYLFIPVFPP